MGGDALLLLYSAQVGPCDSGVGTFGRSENAEGVVCIMRKTNNSFAEGV